MRWTIAIQPQLAVFCIHPVRAAFPEVMVGDLSDARKSDAKDGAGWRSSPAWSGGDMQAKATRWRSARVLA
jgi:hypothetical protein